LNIETSHAPSFSLEIFSDFASFYFFLLQSDTPLRPRAM
jgi:hypothetical protein